jgi:glyoxylase I family protein
MSTITGIHHVSIIVSDTEQALKFYQQVMGLKQDPSRPDLGYPGAWLSIGKHQLHLLELPNPDPVADRPAHGGRDRHLAVSVDSLDDLMATLDQHGIQYTVSRSGRRALFCRDPDGNALECIEL